jgi:hypothetical protein
MAALHKIENSRFSVSRLTYRVDSIDSEMVIRQNLTSDAEDPPQRSALVARCIRNDPRAAPGAAVPGQLRGDPVAGGGNGPGR